MKMRRIPEVDLARIAVKSDFEQKLQLRKLRGFKPPHTLNPFRKAIPDLMNVQHELLGSVPETAWGKIEEKIKKSKETESGIVKNLAVAKALYEFCVDGKIVSYSKPTMKWSVGYGNSVSYWSQFYSITGGQATFFFFDPRLSNSLTVAARRFVFSMMHERLRAGDPDFSTATLQIGCFKKGEKDCRTLKIHSAAGVDLYSYDELNALIDNTYQLWIAELEHRDSEAKRAVGGLNPMGF